MKFKTIEECNARLSEIRSLLDKPEDIDVDALTQEVKEIEARKAELQDEANKTAELRARVAAGEGVVVRSMPAEAAKPKTDVEVRNSLEYGKAFVRGLKENDFSECRALLSTNVTSGTVPVPEFLDNEIRNAWEDCQIMSLVKKTSYKGNVKVGFELSATGAVVHKEGTNAPEEEVLTWGTVELKAENIKKWITVSDEAIEGTTIDTIGEIYKEVAQRIVEKAEEIAITKIISSPVDSTKTAVGVPTMSAPTVAEDTIVKAIALLSGKARDLHIAMNRQTYAAFVAVGLKAKYAVDVFDGLRDRVVFTDALPAITAAEDAPYAIIGDFGYGFQANFPNGNEVVLKLDDLSLAEKDLVKIVGRQYVGMGVVAPKSFVVLTTATD